MIFGLQGLARLDRETWDAEGVAGELVPAGSVFAFLAAHRREVFDDSFTADLFASSTGRPSLPARTGLIADCELTMATGQDNTDAAMGVRLANRDRFHPPARAGTLAP